MIQFCSVCHGVVGWPTSWQAVCVIILCPSALLPLQDALPFMHSFAVYGRVITSFLKAFVAPVQQHLGNVCDCFFACRVWQNSSVRPAYPGAPVVPAQKGGSHLCPHPDPHPRTGCAGTQQATSNKLKSCHILGLHLSSTLTALKLRCQLLWSVVDLSCTNAFWYGDYLHAHDVHEYST